MALILRSTRKMWKSCITVFNRTRECRAAAHSADLSTSAPCLATTKKNPAIAVGVNASDMIVCWHPEAGFPYEHSKPMPRNITELEEANSVLKVQHLESERLKYQEDGPTRDELMDMFHTPKYTWVNKPRRSINREPLMEPDRDGI